MDLDLMKIVSRLKFVVFSIIFISVGQPSIASTEMVHFSLPDLAPTAFQKKRAAAKGETAKAKKGQALQGTLHLPDATSVVPAVIVLVSGDGLRPSHNAWGQWLAENGYAALVIDSYGSRGVQSYADNSVVPMSADAFAAHKFLSSLPNINSARISLMGFSYGATHTIMAVEKDNRYRPANISFNAAISIYPRCQGATIVTAPVLLLLGDADPLLSVNSCLKMIEDASEAGMLLSHHIYAGATHFFDNPDYSRAVHDANPDLAKPAWYSTNFYHPEYHQDAKRRVVEFLNLQK
ncbi:MAG: dienelactone hydrolase family protein [Cohaesibacteraceae bacterium]|nr:dienelactone hydrolase family protein [Cohaesibacteraceae bacterium]MBL4874930.1 dienelactone hydrolase family protein [Cohaesibacteraceae bacterium]